MAHEGFPSCRARQVVDHRKASPNMTPDTISERANSTRSRAIPGFPSLYMAFHLSAVPGCMGTLSPHLWARYRAPGLLDHEWHARYNQLVSLPVAYVTEGLD